MKKISKAKNSFVAHAIVVAVSLFLVAFSLSAPGVAFAEDIKSSNRASLRKPLSTNPLWWQKLLLRLKLCFCSERFRSSSGC